MVDVLATVLAATDATELFGALLFANSFAQRRCRREYGLAALLCVAAAVHATASLVGAASYDRTGAKSALASHARLIVLCP